MSKRIAKKQPGRIRAAVLSWLGVPIELTNAEYWRSFNSAVSDAGVTVNERSMLQLSTVWACKQLIAGTTGTLPLHVYERIGERRRIARTYPLYSIVHSSPNADTTASVYWEACVSSMLLWGAARSEKLMIGNRLVGLKFLAPWRLVRRVRGRSVVWRYTEKDGTQREIPDNRIFTIPGITLDGEEGVSVVQYGVNVFGAALAADAAAAKTFKNGLMPTVYFKYPTFVKKEQREEFRRELKKISGAMHAGESPVLEGGMETGTIGINPTDAQLLQSRAFSVEEICRWFGVPPWMVGHTEKSTSWGTGIEQQMIAFLTFTLMRWLKRIEQAINKDLIAPADQQRYYAEFAIEGLLRADSMTRGQFYSIMVNNGIMTRDEVRVKENYEPRGGNADVLTVQSAMVPIDQIGRSDDGERARAALASWLGQSQQSAPSSQE